MIETIIDKNTLEYLYVSGGKNVMKSFTLEDNIYKLRFFIISNVDNLNLTVKLDSLYTDPFDKLFETYYLSYQDYDVSTYFN